MPMSQVAILNLKLGQKSVTRNRENNMDNLGILNDPNSNNLLFNTEPLNLEELFGEENPM
ncbi:2832_t:CDS:2 [Funneliformis geosporum]|nr:2832_t:CDS:2 [Funneliformis geosporum]